MLVRSGRVLVNRDSYKQEVLADSPLGYWRMDDTSGSTMVDVSGNSHNGTHSNTPTLSQPGPLIVDPNFAIKYNGTNQFSSAAIDLSALAVVTAEIWINTPSYSATDSIYLEYTPNATSPAQNGFILDLTTGALGGSYIGMGRSTPSAWTDSCPNPSAGVFHHWVAVFDRTTPLNTIYIDGVAQTLTTETHSMATGSNFANSTLYFGCRAGTTFFCIANTLLDEVALYAGSLPLARVQAHYSTALKRESGLTVPQAVMSRAGSW